MRTDRLLLEDQGILAWCGSQEIHLCSTASFRINNNSSRRTITAEAAVAAALSSHAWSRDARLVFPKPIWPPTKGKWFLAVFIRTRVNHLRALRHRKNRPLLDIKTITKPNTRNPFDVVTLPMSDLASSNREEGNYYLGSMWIPFGNLDGDPLHLHRRQLTIGCPLNHLNWPGPNRSSYRPWSNCGVAGKRREYLYPSILWPIRWPGACLETWIT